MTGPKHLWSGDWERESADAADGLAGLAPSVAPPDPTAPPPDDGHRASAARLTRSGAIASVLAVLVIAGAAVALTVGGGKDNHPPARTATTPTVQSPFPQSLFPQQQTTPQTTPQAITPTPTQTVPSSVPNQPTVDWLGMEIINGANGTVNVETVKLGSVADTAGFEPGDIITAVQGRQITTAEQIRSVVANIRTGQEIVLQVDRGSSFITIALPMGAQPTTQP
jgi:membrane-associated protease RseP (regulator of RpoE activity)